MVWKGFKADWVSKARQYNKVSQSTTNASCPALGDILRMTINRPLQMHKPHNKLIICNTNTDCTQLSKLWHQVHTDSSWFQSISRCFSLFQGNVGGFNRVPQGSRGFHYVSGGFTGLQAFQVISRGFSGFPKVSGGFRRVQDKFIMFLKKFSE